MPKPLKGDTKDQFISRYMGSAESNKDYPDEKQRYAIAESLWEEHTKVYKSCTGSKSGKTKLKNLVIEKVALVPEGSCSVADIKFYKRREGKGGSTMNYEEVLKMLPADQQTVIQEEINKAKAMLPEGAMSADDKKKMEEEKMKAEAAMQTAMSKLKTYEAAGSSEEDILKSADLDPNVKAILERSILKAKTNEALIVKMREEQETNAIIQKSAEVKLIPEMETKVIPLLKSIKGVEGAVDATLEILKSAQALIEKSGAFGEVGVAGGATETASADAAWAAIEKAANDMVVKGNISKAKAIELVMDAQPDLYNAYVEALKA